MPSQSSSITSHSKMSDNTPPPNAPDDGKRDQFNDSCLGESNTATTQPDEEEHSDDESSVPIGKKPTKEAGEDGKDPINPRSENKQDTPARI
jgi:hypothetical protein